MPVPPCRLRKILTKNRESVECASDHHGGYPASSCSRSLNHYILWSPTLVPEGPKKVCGVNAMHRPASVFINDDESGLHEDYERWLEKIAPHEPVSRYLHNRTGEDNGDAHLKRQGMGREVVVAVPGGKLACGTRE